MWRLLSVIALLKLVKCMSLQKAGTEIKCLLDTELEMMLGQEIKLTDNEIVANEVIMKLKHHDLGNSPKGFTFDPSRHFFDYKDEVKTSPLFKLLKNMPKGANLHVHDTALLSPDYVVNITYHSDLYVCFEEEKMQLIFSRKVPKTTCGSQWQTMKQARRASGNIKKFDQKMRKHFTIVNKNHKTDYATLDAIWDVFNQYFITTGSLFTYKPVWEKYFYDVLKSFKDDNIMYIEIRSVLPTLYDLDGKTYDAVETAESYKRVLDKFMKDHPDFYGAKLIYAPVRNVSLKIIEGYIKTAKQIKAALPDFFAGFDLVGREDGAPLKDFRSVLVKAAKDIKYFFHAGETNQFGTSVDKNIADAIVLGAKRIGHGFTLFKHPLLLQEVKKRDIAIEVSVISNSIGHLADDVRSHPLAEYMAKNLNVVITSDDPGVWEAEPLTHDFYLTFVGVASQEADLKLLKKLALNSLYYSDHDHKDKLIHEFTIRWTKFIDNVVREKW